jgi:glycerol-3-phosphate cytidylyltransferase
MKTGFTCGTFDLLHAGHVLMLQEARQQCDYLIVGLHNDPSIERKHKNLPIQSIVERMIQLKAVKYVDEIWVYNSEQDLLDLLKVLPVSIRILGEEYRNQDFTGRGICEERGIELYYNSRQHNFSSTELRKRIAAR